MSFTILTAVTPNYAEILRYTLPSWQKNAGASRIIIETLDALPGPRETAWYDNTAARCQALRDMIIERLDRGERVLAMDVDCVVLSDLASGFSDNHPISVARWPNINMGVMFFNQISGVPLADMIGRVTALIVESCRKYRGKLRLAGGCWLADQAVWEEELLAFDGWSTERFGRSMINKLDANVWNFCPLPETWERDFRTHKKSIKIVHLKGQGQAERHVVPKRLLERHFAEKL